MAVSNDTRSHSNPESSAQKQDTQPRNKWTVRNNCAVRSESGCLSPRLSSFTVKGWTLSLQFSYLPMFIVKVICGWFWCHSPGHCRRPWRSICLGVSVRCFGSFHLSGLILASNSFSGSSLAHLSFVSGVLAWCILGSWRAFHASYVPCCHHKHSFKLSET